MREQGPDEAIDPRDFDWDEPRVKPGTLVGHYKTIRMLGRGGMAEVYLARDALLGRKVVLKVMLGTGHASDNIAQLTQEAQLLAQFNHPHIVTLYGFGEHAGEPYLAMEFVEGENLRERMGGEPLGLREAERFALAIASALREAHVRNIVHGDLKPENILISKDGRLRVADFGLAKLFAPATGALARTEGVSEEVLRQASLARDQVKTIQLKEQTHPAPATLKTQTSTVRGTPPYMAPEQWMGLLRTPAADVWAFGVVVFELLTGRMPFAESSIYALAARVTSPEPSPELPHGDYPQALRQLVRSALVKDPKQRPNAAELQRLLEPLVYGGTSITVSRDSPFRGLEAFGEEHAPYFFGRDDDIASFVERLRREATIPIVGASGVGKSSFIQAGVIPRLRETTAYTVFRTRPGSNPFYALASRLVRNANTLSGRVSDDQVSQVAAELYDNPGRLSLLLSRHAQESGTQVLLLVDQLEEVCTLVPDRETRMRFLAAICTAADDFAEPVRVIFTARDDFLSRLAESPEARQVLTRVALLQPPGDAALREIITRTTAAVGYAYEDLDLVDRMVDAVANESAALPLLQFAGTMLWERRDEQRKLLLTRVYEEIGGVQGALATHANSMMRDLKESETRLVRQAMLRLITPEGTRRVLLKHDLLEVLGAAAEPLLKRLVDARLLTVRQVVDDIYLEISHESLVRSWDRLTTWLEEGRDELIFLAQLDQAASLWDKRGQRRSEAWSGAALEEAQRQLLRYGSRLTAISAAFIQQSEQVDARRRWLRRGAAIAGAAVLVIVTLVASLVAVEMANKRDEAETGQAKALAEGARAAYLRGDFVSAQAQLRSALEKRDLPVARALWAKLGSDPVVWSKEIPSLVADVAWSPDESTIAVSAEDSTVYLLDAATASIRALRSFTLPTTGAAFSPDGRSLAACDWQGGVGVWDTTSWRFTGVNKTEGATSVCRVAFAPAGDFFATVSGAPVVFLWRADATALRSLPTPEGALAVALWRDQVAAGLASGGVRIWTNGIESRVIAPLGAPVQSLTYSEDGKLFAGLANGEVHALDAGWHIHAHDPPVHNLRVHGGSVYSAAYSDAALKRWDAATGKPTGTWQRHLGAAPSLDISKSGQVVTGGMFERQVKLWRLGRQVVAAADRGHERSVKRVAINTSFIASASEDSTVRLWARDGTQLATLTGHKDAVVALAFSPDGKWLASGGLDNNIMIWSLSSRTPHRVLTGHTSGVYEVAWANSSTLVSASDDRSVREWDISTATQQRRWTVSGPMTSLSLSKDGAMVAAGIDKHWYWPSRAASPQTRDGGAWGVDFNPKSPEYALFTETGDIVVTQRDTAKELRRIVLGERIEWGHYDPDGLRMTCGAQSGNVYILTGETKQVLSGHLGPVAEAVFSPSGDLVVSGGEDASVRLWRDGKAVWGRSEVTRVAGARDGDLVGFANGMIEASGQALNLERAPSAAVVQLRSKGPFVVAGFANGTLGVWDRTSGAELARMKLHGPVAEIIWENDQLSAQTTLNDTATLDLGPLISSYCSVITRVEREIPIVWRENGPQRVRSAGHNCPPEITDSVRSRSQVDSSVRAKPL